MIEVNSVRTRGSVQRRRLPRRRRAVASRIREDGVHEDACDVREEFLSSSLP